MHHATLLLLLPLISSTLLHLAAAASNGGDGNVTVTSCAPARCGSLSITYPFTLIGAQPLHCGYPTFALACDHLAGRAYLSRTFRERLYLVRNISYGDASMVLSVEATFAGNASCRFPDFNVSSGLALFPLRISTGNDELVFVHNCTSRLPRRLMLWPVSCGHQSIEAFVAPSEGSVADGVPQNCSFVTVPVPRAGDARDYERLIGDGFVTEWETLGDCGACSRGGGECRFEEGSFRCACDGSPCSSRDRGNFRLKIGAGVVGALLFLALLSTAYIVHNVRRKQKRSASVDGLTIPGGSPLASPKKVFTVPSSPLTHIFTYEELHEATDGFSDARVLGAGGFGTVYKGILRDGSVVAVKRLYKNSYKGMEQFANEVDILSRLRHPNLVGFYGCTSSSQGSCCRDLLLAYEFIPNGTLADHLHFNDGEESLLKWTTRLGIAVEAAGALAYLHAHQIVHRDVKTCNILLDEEFHVKVADFGLCRLFPPDATHVSTAPQGTPGYVDPAYHHRYQLTNKSDVYSFGVVLVELISSRPAVDMSRVGADVNLASMAVCMIQSGEIDRLVDPRLGYGSASETMKTVDLVAEVAFRCLQPEQDVRPSISEAFDVLKEAHQRMMEKGGCAAIDDSDTVLRKKGRDGSPNSVMHQWISPSTTSNHSTSH